MADDDFDIDIYGDTAEQDGAFSKDEEGDVKIDGLENTNGDIDHTDKKDGEDEQYDDYVDIKVESRERDQMQVQQQIKSTDESSQDLLTIPKQAPRQQGVKRKEGSDDRPIDPGATTALLISDLHWWNTDDDIRGWINQAQCEDELKEVTISEHKINGKSKGYTSFLSVLSLLYPTDFRLVAGKHMSNSPHNRLPQRQNTKSMLLEKVSNTSKSIRQPIQIQTSTHSELFQKTPHYVTIKVVRVTIQIPESITIETDNPTTSVAADLVIARTVVI